MKLPNFLIVGAQKAGTTSLYRYLGQHPQVFMSPVKEPQYFAFGDRSIPPQMIGPYWVPTLPAYRQLFSAPGADRDLSRRHHRASGPDRPRSVGVAALIGATDELP